LSSYILTSLSRKRFVGLAAQKFISEVAADALQFSKLTKKQPQSKDSNGNKTQANKNAAQSTGNVLRMEDLTAALEEYGIDVKRPEFYV
jgi:transcription initiation factor TFIID subunit 10